ncbi:hypothetical protein [Paenibacillus durus]|uniref:Uncharacterized protein n=1 Tax=Paenibacillus durus TaxID=44251 RepID=A0A089HVS9_PAEDU|nr:hypothetical protein [Paenibacillus durus]AIQ14428.1 hypothetical protein PDUR_22875 [Paenibacillus durus]
MPSVRPVAGALRLHSRILDAAPYAATASASKVRSAGLLGLHASDASVQFQGVLQTKYIVTEAAEIENHDFETGDLTGWKVVRGDACTDAHVSEATGYWGGPFGQQGNSHLWGAAVPPYDALTGELHSSYFKLGGSGEINLMIGGGNDIATRYKNGF